MRYLTVLFLTAALAGIASADILDFYVDSFVTPETTDLLSTIPPDAYVTNDLMLDVDSDWLSAVLVIAPDSGGGIYQHPAGANTPPNELLFPAYPCLEYDTYVSDGLGGAPSVEAAVDFGYTVLLFDEDDVACLFYTTAEQIGLLHMARVTLGNTVDGTWRFRATASPEGGPVIDTGDLPIVDGYLVPEPATLGLLAIGGLGVLIRRKR